RRPRRRLRGSPALPVRQLLIPGFYDLGERRTFQPDQRKHLAVTLDVFPVAVGVLCHARVTPTGPRGHCPGRVSKRVAGENRIGAPGRVLPFRKARVRRTMTWSPNSWW